jgi:hypothetical protein
VQCRRLEAGKNGIERHRKIGGESTENSFPCKSGCRCQSGSAMEQVYDSTHRKEFRATLEATE